MKIEPNHLEVCYPKDTIKLELKHLAAYLPYGLNFIYRKSKYELTTANIASFDYQYAKPILRPLSDLSEKYIHAMQRDLLIDDERIISLIQIITEPISAKIGINDRLPYSVFKWLIERYFDIFGLIENNLAVDINTL